MQIKLMLDEVSYKSKPSGTECGRIKFQAKQWTGTIDELISAIENGQTIIPAVMDGTKAENWLEQQLFMVDIDNAVEDAETLTPDNAIAVCRENGISPAFYYYTFSHAEHKPKYRLGFIADEVIREESKRKLIIEALISLFEQADKACTNADRIFFGTNRKAVVLDKSYQISLTDIYSVYRPATVPKKQHKTSNSELDELKQNFDLLSYMKHRNGHEGKPFNKGFMFNNCEICGHHENLAYYTDTNSFWCFSTFGEVGGSVIDYIMHSEKVDLKTAIDKLYSLCGKSNPFYVKMIDSDLQDESTFNDFELPDFPIEAIPTPFRIYIEETAEHTQTAIDMSAMNVLGVVATAVQGQFQIEVKPGYVEPLCIFALIIAKPAERKSGVHQLTTAVLYDYEAKKNREIEPQIARQNVQLEMSKRRLENITRQGNLENTEEAVSLKLEMMEIEERGVREICLIASDVTPEKLTSLMSENGGKMSVISAEGGIFTTLAGQYTKNNPNIETVLKAHAGDSIRVARIGRHSESIDNPRLTLVVSLQDAVIREIFKNKQFRGRGLLARMLYCKPTSRVGSRDYDTAPFTQGVKESYEKAIYCLLEYQNEKDSIKLSEEAQTISRKWFYFIEPLLIDELSSMGDWSGKLHGATLRVAGLLHCMENWNDLNNNLIVSGETMKNAVEIGKYLLEHAKWAYSALDVDERTEDAKYVFNKILESGKTTLSGREIQRLCGKIHLRKMKGLALALELLKEHGLIDSYEQAPTHPGSKPSIMYSLNPQRDNVTDVTEI